MDSKDLLAVPFPSFLPNPSRVLLASFDNWNCSSNCSATSDEKKAVLRSLKAAISEKRNAAAETLESIPVLIANSDPPSKLCGPLSSASPPLKDLLR